MKANGQVCSRGGIVSEDSRKRSREFPRQFDKEIATATVDAANT